MLKRNWGLFVALGIVAAVTVAIGVWTWPWSPRLASYGEEFPRNDHYRPGGKDCDAVSLAAIRDDTKRASQTQTCAKEAEEYRQDTNDLIQQTRAANAAQAQANIASQQLWTGWLQTLGGFLTLAAAVGAAIYAREAASHTRDANLIARENSHRELRAYLSVTSVIVDELDFDASDYAFNVQITNHGQTPGAIYKIWLDAIWMSDKGSVELIHEQREMMIDCFKEPVINVQFKFSGIFEHSDTKGNMITIGILSYKDVFGELHAEEFGWMIDSRITERFLYYTWPLQLGAFSPEVIRQIIEEKQRAQ